MKQLSISLILIGILQACNFSPREDNLIWSDEFNQEDPSLSENWNIIAGNGCPENCGFGNNELQEYTNKSNNLMLKDGQLILTANWLESDSSFTSAKLTSEGKGDWQYGYFEIKAQLPYGRGTWPAIWMLPTQDKPLEWPLDGEIDIMEHVGYNQDKVYGTIHTEAYNHMKGTEKSDSVWVENTSKAFHIYAINWQRDFIEWFVDGKAYHKIVKDKEDQAAWPFDKPFHLILNFAVGGNWGGRHGVDQRVFPQQMKIDYVRVYKNKPK